MIAHRILTEVSRNRLEKCLSVKAEAWARAVLRRTERRVLGGSTLLWHQATSQAPLPFRP